MENNLPELRDIHLPAEGVSLWPLAYGWWLLALLVIMLAVFAVMYKIWKLKSKKHYALNMLASLDLKSSGAAVELSEILRRICLCKYPQAAALYGREWIVFLNNHCQRAKLDDSVSQLLINAPYINPSSTVYNLSDVEKLRSFCKIWIGENL
ncbi:MAG: DUF4381 domain-containing protein [Azospirillum sp.]|nr:DUF4381 domain-containing protein [Azospirillum sp.]